MVPSSVLPSWFRFVPVITVISVFNFVDAWLVSSWNSPLIDALHARGAPDTTAFAFYGKPSRCPSLSCASYSSEDSATATMYEYASAVVTDAQDRSSAKSIVEGVLCPPSEERDRNRAGMEAWGVDPSQPIQNDDPRSEFTYGEFPSDSFDTLVDRAMEVAAGLSGGGRGESATNQKIIDVGSGCGRLVLHAALSRGGGGGDGSTCDVHGVEIGESLHGLAVSSMERGVEQGWFVPATSSGVDEVDQSRSSSRVAFHKGDINNIAPDLFADASVLFAYSSVWDCEVAFNVELEAMVLAAKWSKMFADAAPNGCVAITTDRILNPEYGWRLVDRLDVENPIMFGSTGYISVLEK